MIFMKKLVFNGRYPCFTSPFVSQIFNRRVVQTKDPNFVRFFATKNQEIYRPSEKISDLFDRWCEAYEKRYVSEEVKLQRLKVFEEKCKRIVEHNSRANSSHTEGLNQYSDLTFDEFKTTMLMPRPSIMDRWLRSEFQHLDPYEKISDVFDRWCQEYEKTYDSEEEKLHRLKVFENNYQFIIEHNTRAKLSSSLTFYGLNEDSDLTYDEFKTVLISSGYSDLEKYDPKSGSAHPYDLPSALQYVVNNGIATEASYAQFGRKGDLKSGDRVTIDGYCAVRPRTEKALQAAVARQPVSVVLEIDESFVQYSGGIFRTHACSTACQAALVVGYGKSDDGEEHWIIKNSWGTSWGEDGYMRMLRNSGLVHGVCGIAGYAWYPTKLG